MTPAEHEKAMVRLITDVSRDTGQRTWEVFNDWVECAAIAHANVWPTPARAEREDRYQRHVSTYGAENMRRFAHLLGHLTMWPEQEPTDALGHLYMSLEIGNDHTGQFFTPFHVSKLMAALTTDESSLVEQVAKRGFIAAHEPTVGAGGMVIALAVHMREQGLNPQQQLWVSGVDIDITCVHMAFLQLSLLGIPAEIIHGDALTLTTHSVWHTAFHHLGHWQYRVRNQPELKPLLLPSGPTTQAGLFEATP